MLVVLYGVSEAGTPHKATYSLFINHPASSSGVKKGQKNMADELEKLLGEDEDTSTQDPSAGDTAAADNAGGDSSQDQTQEDPVVAARKAELAQLDIAKTQALADLAKIRSDKRKAKQGIEDDDEDLPKINLEDPSAKAWDNRIKDTVAPLASEQEQERQEILGISLKKFLSDKPSLAKNTEKLKEVMDSYESLSAGRITGKNSEIVTEYLERAYASVFHEELRSGSNQRRVQQAQEDALFSDAAVDSGTGGYAPTSEEDTTQPKLSAEQRDILRSWNMTPQEWFKLKKEHSE